MNTKIASNPKSPFLLSLFFKKSLLVFLFLGGVSIQPGSIQSGVTSCEAAGICKAPAKEKVEYRTNRLYQELLRKFMLRRYKITNHKFQVRRHIERVGSTFSIRWQSRFSSLSKYKSKDGHGLEALGIIVTLSIIALGGLAVLFALQAFGVIAIMGLASGFLAAFASLVFLGLMLYGLFLFYWN